MIVAMTGHRPEKIPDPVMVQELIYEELNWINPERLIQGMASGVDLWSAVEAARLAIPYTCARPWAGHKPRGGDANLYQEVLENAAEVVDVNPGWKYPGPWVYEDRNRWMIDRADIVLAVWDGTPGGTKNAVDYAIKTKKPIKRIGPKTGKVGDWPDAIQSVSV